MLKQYSSDDFPDYQFPSHTVNSPRRLCFTLKKTVPLLETIHGVTATTSSCQGKEGYPMFEM